MKTCCSISHRIETMSCLNLDLVFYFGKTCDAEGGICHTVSLHHYIPGKEKVTAAVICVIAKEIAFLIHRSRLLLRELLPHEPVVISIFHFLLNRKKKKTFPGSPGGALSWMTQWHHIVIHLKAAKFSRKEYAAVEVCGWKRAGEEETVWTESTKIR